MLLKPRQMEHRPPALIREHYEVERELADRLRRASREERRTLYRSVYNELYQRVPHHPQLVRKASPELTRKAVAPQLRLLRPYLRPDATVLEVGPGDCSLSVALAAQVQQVYGLDVSDEITQRITLPSNFQLILSDGTSVPLPPESVDLVFSNQLMEHLHPDDAVEQLEEVCRVLRRGGVYICVTPNRLNGPHDVSQHFDPVATGFHLKEYTVGELTRLFRQVGFRKVQALLGSRGFFIAAPVPPIIAGELVLAKLPPKPRRALGRTLPARGLLGIRLLAIK